MKLATQKQFTDKLLILVQIKIYTSMDRQRS